MVSDDTIYGQGSFFFFFCIDVNDYRLMTESERH